MCHKLVSLNLLDGQNKLSSSYDNSQTTDPRWKIAKMKLWIQCDWEGLEKSISELVKWSTLRNKSRKERMTIY